MTKEQVQTINWYRKNPNLLNTLKDVEIEALKNSLGLHYEHLYTKTKIKKITIKQKKKNVAWEQYKAEVKEITKQQPIDTLENSDKPRAKHKKDFWSKELYSLDHKISIWYGYQNNIDPKIIGDISNLRWITAYENTVKGVKCV